MAMPIADFLDYLGDLFSGNDVGKYGNFGGSSHPIGEDGQPLSSAQLEGIPALTNDFGLDQSYKAHDIAYARVREAEDAPIFSHGYTTGKKSLGKFSPLGSLMSQMKADEDLAMHHLDYIANTPMATEEQKNQARLA